MKTAKQVKLDVSVMKWCVKQFSCDTDLTAVEIKSAALTMTEKIEIQLKANDG
jgi:hypothetical protein